LSYHKILGTTLLSISLTFSVCSFGLAYAQDGKVSAVSSGSYVDSIGWYNVVGEVRNNARITFDSVQIIATFYDTTNQVVGTSYTYANIDSIRPGEKSPFHLILFDTEQSPKITSYRLLVIGDTGKAKPATLQLRVGESFYDTIGWYHIVGEITNRGTSTAKSVEVSAAFYDSQGQVLAADYTYTQPSDIPPGETAPFEIISFTSTGSAISSASVNAESNEYSVINDSLPTFVEQSNTKSVKDYGLNLSFSGSVNEKAKSLTISIKNPKTSDAKIYEVHITLSDDARVKSASAPSGWIKEINGDSVTFTTESKPLLANKSGKFTIKLDKVVKSLDWDAYDEDGNIINSKTAKVTVRK
jgi:hypothetical protein